MAATHGRPARIRRLRNACSERGQVIAEYVTIVGIITLTVIACMTVYVGPVATAFIRVFRRMAVYLSSAG